MGHIQVTINWIRQKIRGKGTAAYACDSWCLGERGKGDGEIQGLFKLWPVLSSRSDEEQLRERAESREFGGRVLVWHAGSHGLNHEHTERNTVERKKGVVWEERGRIVYLDTHREDKEAQVIQQG